jgi:hypothetical protein
MRMAARSMSLDREPVRPLPPLELLALGDRVIKAMEIMKIRATDPRGVEN